VKIPGTGFNRTKKMTFFTAGEVYDQRNLYGNTATLSFIPTARMLSGDLSTASIEAALNLPTGASVAMCPTPYGCVGTNNFGAAYSPATTQVDVQGHSIVGGQIPYGDLDPNASAYTRFYPKINRVPQPQGNPPDCTNAAKLVDPNTNVSLLGPGQLCTDNINYDVNIFAQHNGFQYHARVDQNFTDATKLYVTYDYELVSDQAPVTNTYYAGSSVNIIPSPTGALTHAHSHRLSVNNTHTFGPTLTNEAVLAGVYFFSPAQLQSNSMLQDANTGFTGPRYYENGDTQLPEIINYQGGVPDFAMGYFDPSRGAPKRKYSVNIADNLTKQLQRHSLKVGFYAEQSANNEFVQGYNDPQGQLSFNQYQQCNVYSVSNSNSGTKTGLGNSVGNFLNGCDGFTQVNKFQSGDMKYNTIDAYATDDWQATKKLTLTFGIRSHGSMGRFPRQWPRSLGTGEDPAEHRLQFEPERSDYMARHRLAQRKGHYARYQPSSVWKPEPCLVLLATRRTCVRHVWKRQDYFPRRMGSVSLSRLLLHLGRSASDLAGRFHLQHSRQLCLHAGSDRQFGAYQCGPADSNSGARPFCESNRTNLRRLQRHAVHDPRGRQARRSAACDLQL
jgi:hypothetical protein